MGLIKFHKRRNLVSLKLSAIWGNLSLHHSCLPLPKKTSFLQFGQVESIHGHLFEKIFLVCISPLSPQTEYKKDDEHFANHLQMYLSRTFSKAKNSVICSEYPMRSKFHLSKWETYFSQFIDKYLKIEEVEYLIHYGTSLILCKFSLFSQHFWILLLSCTLFSPIYTEIDNWDSECCSRLNVSIFPMIKEIKNWSFLD